MDLGVSLKQGPQLIKSVITLYCKNTSREEGWRGMWQFKWGPVEFYLTKTANWVRALYPHKAQRFSAIQSDRLRLFALKQSSTPSERVRGGKREVVAKTEPSHCCQGYSKQVLYILSSGFKVSCTMRKGMGSRAPRREWIQRCTSPWTPSIFRLKRRDHSSEVLSAPLVPNVNTTAAVVSNSHHTTFLCLNILYKDSVSRE